MPAGSLRRVADPADEQAVREAVIDTYAGSQTATAAELVAQYERVTDYCAEHPNLGSAAVASALGLPRSRLQAWVDDDGRPDAARGVETLTRRGWLQLDWAGSTLRCLTGLLVWTIAGGSLLRQSWRPAWSVSAGTESDIERIGTLLGVDWQQRHVDDGRSGTEWVPARDGSVLGRLLAVLGAPTAAGEGPALPPWLVLDAPRPARLDAARVLVRQRGTPIDRDATPVQLKIRPAGRHEAVVRLLRSVAPPDGTIQRFDSGAIRLDRRAAELLVAPPLFADPLSGSVER